MQASRSARLFPFFRQRDVFGRVGMNSTSEKLQKHRFDVAFDDLPTFVGGCELWRLRFVPLTI